jgi:S1-C subfamily serine protease
MEPDKDTISGLKLEGKRGALASQVFIGSPADKGGIKPGDFITHVCGKEAKGVNQLQLMVGELRAGDSASFTVIRDGRAMDVQVRIEKRTEQAETDNKNLWPGVTVVPINDQFKEAFQFESNVQGLVALQIVPGSPAEIIGIRRGDRITAINGEKVSDIATFYKVLREKAGSELQFGITRGDSSLESLKFKRP